jgi:predicted transcriptional regulator
VITLESISEQLKEMLQDRKVFKSVNLFKCILGLNELESNVFSYLLQEEKTTTNEISNVLGKDRSSIQRALQNLIEVKMVDRESMSLKDFTDLEGKDDINKRGYLYVYKAKDIKVIKRQFLKLLEEWYNSMINYVQSLDSLFDCYKTDGEIC